MRTPLAPFRASLEPSPNRFRPLTFSMSLEGTPDWPLYQPMRFPFPPTETGEFEIDLRV